MHNGERRSAIEVAAEHLRGIALTVPQGNLIGSEDDLVRQLACSRGTMRQAARVLEHEGLIRVRRGINGGYFSARPDAGTIGHAVAAFLQTIHPDPPDVVAMASALWAEALRKAAAMPVRDQPAIVALRKRIAALRDSTRMAQILDFELASQALVFEIGNSTYIKLIFDVNHAFARQTLPPPAAAPGNDDEFFPSWRYGKLMELDAVSTADVGLATMAANYNRGLWLRRIGMAPRDA